jgi:DNA repair exonuclease SbcCD nuclease subunit
MGWKYLILGDIHLGRSASIGKPGIGKELNSRIKDQLDLLDWTLELAKKSGVSNIIITGDVYHEPRPHPELISSFMAWLKRCEYAHLAVHIIAGNHDYIRTGSFTASALDIVPAVEFSHATSYKDITQVEMAGITFTFLPYRNRRMYDGVEAPEAIERLKAELKASLTPTNQKRILIGHISIEGAIKVGDEIADTLNEMLCPADMFADWGMVWMGHIHNPHIIKDKNPLIAHVGSMDRSDFSMSEVEDGTNKSVVLLDNDCNYELVIIPTRNLRKIVVDVPAHKDSTDFVINEIGLFDKKSSIKEAIVRIEVQLPPESPHVDRKKIQDYIYTKLKAHYICEFSEYRKISTIQIDPEHTFDSSMSIFDTVDKYFNAQNMPDAERLAAKSLALECAHEFEEGAK